MHQKWSLIQIMVKWQSIIWTTDGLNSMSLPCIYGFILHNDSDDFIGYN